MGLPRSRGESPPTAPKPVRFSPPLPECCAEALSRSPSLPAGQVQNRRVATSVVSVAIKAKVVEELRRSPEDQPALTGSAFGIARPPYAGIHRKNISRHVTYRRTHALLSKCKYRMTDKDVVDADVYSIRARPQLRSAETVGVLAGCLVDAEARPSAWLYCK